MSGVVVLALLFAGCMGGGDDASPASSETPTVEPTIVVPTKALDSTRATVVGAVYSESLRPVAGATVVAELDDFAINTTTDSSGRYALRDIAPGQYRMFAQALEFAPNITNAALTRGEVTEVNFLLRATPGVAPVTDVREARGFIECEVGIVLNTLSCYPAGLSTNDAPVTSWPYNPQNVSMIVIEGAWVPPANGLGQQLRLAAESPSGATYASVVGPSPLKVEYDLDLFEQGLPPNVVEDNFQTRMSAPATPGGAAYQQQFAVFISIFYHHLPTPGYTAIPDGFQP